MLGVLALNTFAQNKCNLQIGIYEFKEVGSSEQFPVRDAKINLVDTKSKKSLKISKNTDVPTFADILEGEYKVTVSKDEFKKTLEIFSTDCSLADAQNTFSIIVFLWKGSSKQKVEIGKSGGSSGYYDIKGDKPVDNGAVLLAKPEYSTAS